MPVKIFIKYLALILFITGTAVTTASAANGHFTMLVSMNGRDVTESETITIDPEEAITMEIYITEVTSDVILEDVVIDLTFAGQTVFKESRTLGQQHVAAGDSFFEEITIEPREFLKSGKMTLVTGIYGSRFRVIYATGGREMEWRADKNIKIPGNPVATPAGAAGVIAGLVALTSIVMLVKSVTTQVIATAGTILPAGVNFTGTPGLKDLILNRLEPTARGKVVGNVVKAARNRIIKDSCPICESRLKHRQCLTCRKSAKEVRREYTEKIKELALEGGQLIASGQAHTLDEITSILGISVRLGTDVITILKHAKLIKVRGLARKVMGKAITAGISSGISAIIWITVGGFAVLSTGVLAGILIAADAVPFIITKSLQAKTKSEIRKLKSRESS